MYYFENNYEYMDPFSVVFLCGSRFNSKDTRDKRIILKDYIKLFFPSVKVLILEEHFKFKPKNTNKYLAYDDIFLKNLSDVEELAALFADRIIVVHDTFSTAAEIGMFASNSAFMNKVCVLVPDGMSIEEDKIKGFIQLAFNNYSTPDKRIKVIRYYPDVEIKRSSERRSIYYTYFHGDSIGTNLGNEIKQFIYSDLNKKKIHYYFMRYHQSPTKEPQNIDYSLSENGSRIIIYVHVETLKIQLIPLLLIPDVSNEIKKSKKLHEHISFIEDIYKIITINTIAEQEARSIPSNCDILIKESTCPLRFAIGYYLYLLQAIGFLRLERLENNDNNVKRSIVITSVFSHQDEIQALQKMIKCIKKSTFGGLNL